MYICRGFGYVLTFDSAAKKQVAYIYTYMFYILNYINLFLYNVYDKIFYIYNLDKSVC